MGTYGLSYYSIFFAIVFSALLLGSVGSQQAFAGLFDSRFVISDDDTGGDCEGNILGGPGPMKFAVQVRDNKHGVQNTYLNEGVQFKDAHAYPYIETAFEAPLEVEPLCIGEDVFHRGNCAFEKVRDWTIKNAEETMRQMYNNEYNYK